MLFPAVQAVSVLQVALVCLCDLLRHKNSHLFTGSVSFERVSTALDHEYSCTNMVLDWYLISNNSVLIPIQKYLQIFANFNKAPSAWLRIWISNYRNIHMDACDNIYVHREYWQGTEFVGFPEDCQTTKLNILPNFRAKWHWNPVSQLSWRTEYNRSTAVSRH